MYHYHIVWGPITGKEPSVLDFLDREEALAKFEEIGRAVEETEKFPNLPSTATKSTPEAGTIMIKLETLQTRICFLYCEHDCLEHEKTSDSMLN